VETIYQLAEAEAAVRGIRRATDLPVLVSLTFSSTPRGFFTLMGDTPGSALAALEAMGADMVGANCTLTGEEMVTLAAEMRAATGLPLVVQPNAGQPEVDELTGRTVYRADPEVFAGQLLEMINQGVEAIGGCCGTEPRFIEEIRRQLGKGKGKAR